MRDQWTYIVYNAIIIIVNLSAIKTKWYIILHKVVRNWVSEAWISEDSLLQ